jgi:hypothetical protein
MVGRDILRYLCGLIVGGPSLLAPELADDSTGDRRSTRPQTAQVGPIRFRSRSLASGARRVCIMPVPPAVSGTPDETLCGDGRRVKLARIPASLWPGCGFTANMNSCSGNRTNIRPQLVQREVVLADA